MRDKILVTGGAGYVGAVVCDELLRSGRDVRVLDSLLYAQSAVAEGLADCGAEVIRGDICDRDARRNALKGVDAVVHLAAIVGDPACARDSRTSQAVNVHGSAALAADAVAVGVERFVFASTCSNYGRMADPTLPIDEHGLLRPISLYAKQKVAIERFLLTSSDHGLAPTSLRFATIYGVAPRMRFDLTVNEFVRDLWGGRRLEVFGEQFWRPYLHVRDAARAVTSVLEALPDKVAHAVFNVGHSHENYRKHDLIELIRTRIDTGEVVFVTGDEDPRDYKVNFDKINAVLGYETTMTVERGIDEVIEALQRSAFSNPWDAIYRNA